MARKKSKKAATTEALVQQALAGITNKTYKSAYHTAITLGIPRSTVYDHLKIHSKSRSQGRVSQQLLSEAEESALAQWIKYLTVSGTPAQYSTV